MTVQQLIESLQEVQEEFGDDCEVRLAHQPHWPFEYAEGEQLGYLPSATAAAIGWGK
jgi:hypothetical protein